MKTLTTLTVALMILVSSVSVVYAENAIKPGGNSKLYEVADLADVEEWEFDTTASVQVIYGARVADDGAIVHIFTLAQGVYILYDVPENGYITTENHNGGIDAAYHLDLANNEKIQMTPEEAEEVMAHLVDYMARVGGIQPMDMQQMLVAQLTK